MSDFGPDFVEITHRAGDRVGGPVDISEQMGEGCVLIYDRPDVVKAPAGLEGHGVAAGVVLHIEGTETFRGQCPACRVVEQPLKVWSVTHRPTGKKFSVIETVCCKQFCWAAV